MNKSFLAALLLAALPPAQAGVAAGPAAPGFQPPAESSLGDDDYARTVRLGENIFAHTQQYAGAYVGNDLSCGNCHLDAGRRADSAPLWGAYVLYPAYRAKTRQVDTFGMRLQGCFKYSMNGKAPPLDSPEMVALETYSQWLATGAPVGARLPGHGYRKLPKPAQAPDFQRGGQLFAQRCAPCHNGDGSGRRAGAVILFPPLWGPRSYNWGAGMANLGNAAGFIQANMPYGNGNTLSVQQAWDLAAFVDGHERPQDPRYTGTVAQTRQRYHDSPDSPYGTVVDGHLLGSDSPPSGPQGGP